MEKNVADKIIDCMTSPVKSRLLIEINARKKATAKELAVAFEDIPQATLYRNLKQMAEAGILKVVGETPIRGTVEKTYGIAVDLDADLKKLIEGNSGQAYLQAYVQYALGFAKLFSEYAASPNINIEADLSGFSLVHTYLSDDELTEVAQKLSEVLGPLSEYKPTPGRKPRTLGLIFSPPGA